MPNNNNMTSTTSPCLESIASAAIINCTEWLASNSSILLGINNATTTANSSSGDCIRTGGCGDSHYDPALSSNTTSGVYDDDDDEIILPMGFQIIFVIGMAFCFFFFVILGILLERHGYARDAREQELLDKQRLESINKYLVLRPWRGTATTTNDINNNNNNNNNSNSVDAREEEESTTVNIVETNTEEEEEGSMSKSNFDNDNNIMIDYSSTNCSDIDFESSAVGSTDDDDSYMAASVSQVPEDANSLGGREEEEEQQQQQHENGDDDQCCPICLSSFHDGDIVCESNNVACQHVFHKECIALWLGRHERCPVCRECYLLEIETA